MKKRVLLLQPNIGMPDTGVYINHGLACIAGALRASGYSPEIHIVTLKMLKARLQSILQHRDDCLLAGISIYSNQWQYVKEISQILKMHGLTVIGGGPHCTLFPEAISETAAIDAFVVGEGERTICEIAARLESGESLDSIPGLWRFSCGKGIISGPLRAIEPLDALPEPAYDLYPRDIVLGYPGLMFSRGCPYNCTYCCNSSYRKRTGNTGARFLSVERALERSRKYIALFAPPYLNFDDDTFTKNTEWISRFLEKYSEEINLPFNCNVRPETITPMVCRLLRRSGGATVALGVESGDETLRRTVLNRAMTDALILRAGGMIREAGLSLATFNMTGLPGETLRLYWKTVALNRLLRPARLQMTVYYPFRGTELGNYCYANQLVREDVTASSYFAPSVLKLKHFPRWQIVLAQRSFKFLVFVGYAPIKALFEVLKDFVKAIPGAHCLIPPYLALKKAFGNRH